MCTCDCPVRVIAALEYNIESASSLSRGVIITIQLHQYKGCLSEKIDKRHGVPVFVNIQVSDHQFSGSLIVIYR